jgi:transcriptional regulator with XRE-family HTH domain
MTPIFERVYEIKKATGWSQERIGAETGLALSTISRIFRVPGYSGNETSNKLIKQLHEQTVQSPFPAYMEQLFNHYEHWKEQYTKKEFANHLDILEPLLKNHKSIDSYELVAGRVCWLLGHIDYDRAFYLKNGHIVKAAESALAWYQKALEILDHHQDKRLIVQQYKIQQCIVSTKFNLCDPSNRADNEEIRRWFLEMNYIQIVEAVIKEDDWNWIAARNGLIAASILKDFGKCLFFWEAMKKVNKSFANFDFKPANELPAISQDSDLVWFVEQGRGQL